MATDEEGTEDDVPPELQFEMDFYRGVLAFVTLASVMRGQKPVEANTVIEEMLAPVVGNRNKSKVTLAEVMPELYRKVIDYCGQSLALSDSITEEMEN